MPTLLFVRHGQASFGMADYDVLSPTGERQAQHVAGVLRHEGPRVTRVVSGSLRRQQGTVAPIATAFGIEAEIDPRWDEYHSDDILEHHSDSPVREHRRPDSSIPKPTSAEFQTVLEAAILEWMAAGAASSAGEPWPGFTGRVGAALAQLGTELGSGETAIVSTSGGVLAALCVALLAVPAPAFVTFNRSTINVGITRVGYGRSGATLLSFNEQGHLLGPDGSLVTYR